MLYRKTGTRLDTALHTGGSSHRHTPHTQVSALEAKLVKKEARLSELKGEKEAMCDKLVSTAAGQADEYSRRLESEMGKWQEQAKRILQREGVGRGFLRALVVVTLQQPLPNVMVFQADAKAHHGFPMLLSYTKKLFSASGVQLQIFRGQL